MSSPTPADTTSYISATGSITPVKKTCCRPKVLGLSLLITGTFFVAFAISYGIAIPALIDGKLTDAATTCDLDDVTDRYLNPHGDCELCVPYYINLHPFHITNAMSVYEDPTILLKVQEKGPYVYRKFSIKTDISFQGDHMTYKVYNRFTFMPKMSCEGCTADDKVMTMSVGYLALMTKAGGEKEFIMNVLNGITDDETVRDLLVGIPGFTANLLRVFYALSSLDVTAMAKAAQFMDQLNSASPIARLGGAQGIGNAQLNGWQYTGMFVQLTIHQLAMGTPNLLAGMAAVAGGKVACGQIPTLTGMDVKTFCSSCDLSKVFSSNCRNYFGLCGSCQTAMAIHAKTKVLCPTVQAFLKTQNKDVGLIKNLIAGTCGTCLGSFADARFCLAPIPGAVTGPEPDYNVFPIDVAAIKSSTVNTGCDDIIKVSEYISYEGITSQVFWNAKQDMSRYPTTAELNTFGNSSPVCGINQRDDIYCSQVMGSDGNSFPPAGTSINGFKTNTEFTTRDLYVAQVKTNITIYKGEEVRLKGTKLFRFRPIDNILSPHAWNADSGTGRPYKGVQLLGFANTGLLAFLSFPFFMHGDVKFLTDIELYTRTGDQMTPEFMYSSKKNIAVNQDVVDRYSTYLDIEPASGKVFNARKRLQAGYALTKLNDGVISDVTNPEMKPEIIVPAFWAEEKVAITDTLLNKVQTAASLNDSAVPVLIVLLLLGVIVVVVGIKFWRKYKKGFTTITKTIV